MIYAPIPLNEIEIKVNNLTQSLKPRPRLHCLWILQNIQGRNNTISTLILTENRKEKIFSNLFLSSALPWKKKQADITQKKKRASLVAQWLRICLPVQRTRVRALVWEDPTCRGATRPVSHNYWACVSGACAPQQERPQQWKVRAPWWRVAPACRN